MISRYLKESVNHSRKLGKSLFETTLIIMDSIYHRLRHGFSNEEYYTILKLYEMDVSQKRQYISNLYAANLAMKVNGGRLEDFDNKAQFLENNASLIKRDWILIKEDNLKDYLKFIDKHPSFIDKPNKGSFGVGIRRLDVSGYDLKKKEELYKLLKGRLLEEQVIGCEMLQLLHPQSLNTVRVITLKRKGKEPCPIYSFLKIGRDESIVDNGHSGGIWIIIDISNGHVIGDALSCDGHIYNKHPNTGELLTEIVIPCWERVIFAAIQAAYNNPKAVIAGWDIALNERYQPVLIEGNCTPNVDVIQAGLHRGLKDEIVTFLRDYS